MAKRNKELSSALKVLTKHLGDTLISVSKNPFNITYSKEINCDNLPDSSLSTDIFEHSEYKAFFSRLYKIKRPIVYWFDITSNHSSREIREKMNNYRARKDRKNFPAMKKSFDESSRTMYVGKMKRDIRGRMFVHLGYYSIVGTQGLQLCHWAKGTGLKVRLNIIELPFDNSTANLSAHYELELAKKLRPLAGKHR